MALVVKDRVKETTATTGTGTLTLAGAVAGFQTFTSVLSNGDTTYYGIFESSTGEFEVGLGTFTSSGTTLARTTILESSNSGSAINLTAGAADVFITQPAEKAVYLDGSGYIATADGRNLTNVDAATLDSLDSTQFLRSDTSDTMTGDLTVSENLKADGGTLIMGDDAYSTSTSYVGMKTSFMSGSTDYMIISGHSDGNTYVSAKSGSDVLINGGGNVSTYGIKVYPDQNPTVGTSNYTIWHSGNDGSGSGLDADTLDGVQGSSYLRSDAADTATGAITLAAANFAEQLEINRSSGAYYSVIKYSNTAGELGKLGFTQSSNLIVRLGTSGTDNTIWHSGNDGSGSGLDADTVDGIQASSFLRSDANDTTTGQLTVDNDNGVKVVYGTETTNVYYTGYGIDSQRVATYFRPTNDNTQTLYVGGSGSANDWANIELKVGNDDNVTINGNTVFHQANLIESTTFSGTYPVLFGIDNTTGRVFENNNITFDGTANNLDVNGNITVDNIYLASGLIHEGDTNTKIEFNAADQISFETGGSQRAYINNSDFVVQSALKEDYDALSGTTPTIDVDAGGAFSLTMTGNTTFTFSSCTSGVIAGFVLQLTGNGGTVTYPNTVDFAGGTAPDAPANGETDILVFFTRDGGTTWYGALAIDAAAQGHLMSFGFTSFAQTTYGDSGVVDVSPPITGLVGASGVGSVTVTGEANVSPTGVSGTGQVGTATATPRIVVDVTGVVAQGFVGSMSTGGNAFVQPTGVAGTGGVGQISLVGNVIVSPTGVSGTGEVGDATAAAGAIVPPTGLEATGGVGSVTVTPRIVVNPTGVAGTGGIGTPVVTGDANVPPTGLEATGGVGSVTISADANVSPTGLSGTGQVGSVVATGGATATVTGVSATGGVGSVTVTGKAVVSPTGVSATGEVTSVIVWGRIIPDPGNTWTEETPNPNTTWTDIAA